MHTPPLMMLPAGRNRATSPWSARPRLVRARGLATNIELVRATPTISAGLGDRPEPKEREI